MHGLVDRRMNVALTRAKNHLFIVGSKRNLSGNRLWSQVIGHCAGKASLDTFCKSRSLIRNDTCDKMEASSPHRRRRRRGCCETLNPPAQASDTLGLL